MQTNYRMNCGLSLRAAATALPRYEMENRTTE